jgi:monothiol glutaredoxin
MFEWSPAKIQEIISQNPIVVFGKGTKKQPQCGFTMKALQALNHCGVDYEVVNIFDSPQIKELLVDFTQWPTTPQIFINGNFIGGSDIILEMLNNGELQKLLFPE